MEVELTPEAVQYLQQRGARELTVESFVVAGCCAPDLPPVVHAGAPRDPSGFLCVERGGWRVYVDSLLEPPGRITVGVRRHLLGGAELAVLDWPEPGAAGGGRPEGGERAR